MHPGRSVYFDIAELLVTHAACSSEAERGVVAELLVVLNSEDAPPRDQDIIDLFSDLYLLVTQGQQYEHYPEGLRTFEDANDRIRLLRQTA